MSAVFTPGPWIAVKNKWDEFVLVSEPTDANVALLDDNESDGDWPQYEANARLIAAAPELLEALENLRWAHTDETDAQALAAIRKARGEA